MKQILLIALFIFTNNLLAQVDSLFMKANKLYQQEKYDEALILYTKIEAQQIQSDELFYNMANAYYKTNQVAPSIYYYEKALLLNPNNTDAAFNLSFAKRMAIDNIEALPKTIAQKFSKSIIQKLSYNSWAWVAVAMSFLFAVLFLLYHFSYSSVNKRFYFVSSIISALFILIATSFAYSNYNTVKTNKTAIVFAQQTNVKSAPTNSSEVSFELHEGTKVKLLESLDNWRKIKIADGKVGWIHVDDLKELE